MKISEYTSVSKLTDDNLMLIDGSSGTKTILMKDAILAALDLVSPETHRMVFRGKEIGSGLTSAQEAAIQSGTFEDLWLGDYWTINGVVWRIVDFDYWFNTGDTVCNTHHVVVMPDSALYSIAMNSTPTTAGGYKGSAMYTNNLTTAVNSVNSAFGSSKILTHREYVTNAVSNGKPSAGEWTNSELIIPNEFAVYGHSVFGPTSDGTTLPMVHTIDRTQLALFQVAPRFIATTDHTPFWLRDVVTTEKFARVESSGLTGAADANSSLGVRPMFAIG